ncbi:hypothetical protein D3C73_1127920 [compost metagenome]
MEQLDAGKLADREQAQLRVTKLLCAEPVQQAGKHALVKQIMLEPQHDLIIALTAAQLLLLLQTACDVFR